MDQVFDFIDKSSALYVSELQRLLKQPSVSECNKDIIETAGIVKSQLEGISEDIEVIQLNEHRSPILFGEVPGESKITIGFYSHYDTKSPGSSDEWKYPPFSATIDGGKIYGRGVATGKGDLLARIKAVESFIEIKKRIPLNVKFLIEGEAQIGSPALIKLFSLQKQILYADVWVYIEGGYDAKGRIKLVFPRYVSSDENHSKLKIQNRIGEIANEFYQNGSLIFRDSSNMNPVVKVISQLGIPSVGLSISNKQSNEIGVDENINTADFIDGIKLISVIIGRLTHNDNAF